MTEEQISDMGELEEQQADTTKERNFVEIKTNNEYDYKWDIVLWLMIIVSSQVFPLYLVTCMLEGVPIFVPLVVSLVLYFSLNDLTIGDLGNNTKNSEKKPEEYETMDVTITAKDGDGGNRNSRKRSKDRNNNNDHGENLNFNNNNDSNDSYLTMTNRKLLVLWMFMHTAHIVAAHNNDYFVATIFTSIVLFIRRSSMSSWLLFLLWVCPLIGFSCTMTELGLPPIIIASITCLPIKVLLMFLSSSRSSSPSSIPSRVSSSSSLLSSFSSLSSWLYSLDLFGEDQYRRKLEEQREEFARTNEQAVRRQNLTVRKQLAAEMAKRGIDVAVPVGGDEVLMGPFPSRCHYRGGCTGSRTDSVAVGETAMTGCGI